MGRSIALTIYSLGMTMLLIPMIAFGFYLSWPVSIPLCVGLWVWWRVKKARRARRMGSVLQRPYRDPSWDVQVMPQTFHTFVPPAPKPVVWNSLDEIV